MAPEHTGYDTVDEAALALGLGLVVFGAAGIGVFETLLGSVHVTRRISGVGIIVLHTSFSPHLRAAVIALGFLVLCTLGVSRVGRAVVA